VGTIDTRLDNLGLALPPPPQAPSGVTLPFEWIRIHGERAFASGHGALSADGSIAPPAGQVPREVTVEQAQHAAVGALLSMLSTLRAALGDLDRIAAWLTVTGFVNAAPDFAGTTLVVNPASELLLDIFGPEIGAHARTAVGYTTLPFRMPVVLAAELAIRT
jgi:enamine deaminase RidA (YjgF/YER057c/UK114 family)